MFGHGSKDRYPPKSGNKFPTPNENANASNGKITGHGSQSSYPNASKGNTWPAPNNRATASKGQTTGHPSQKTTYPAKGPRSQPDASMRVKSSTAGRDRFVPKGGNKL